MTSRRWAHKRSEMWFLPTNQGVHQAGTIVGARIRRIISPIRRRSTPSGLIMTKVRSNDCLLGGKSAGLYLLNHEDTKDTKKDKRLLEGINRISIRANGFVAVVFDLDLEGCGRRLL